MKKSEQQSDEQWVANWLDAVRDGKATMSQRTLKSIDAHGGATAIKSAAKSRGVHLVELTDDKGSQIVAASRHPFKTLC